MKKKQNASTYIDSLNILPVDRKVLKYVLSSGTRGATCAEIEKGENMLHQTASAAITRLRYSGYIAPVFNHGYLEKRLTPKNRPAQVYTTSFSGQN